MGLKPRINKPTELRMTAGGGGYGRRATVDLQTGRCQAQVSSRDWNQKNSKWVSSEVDIVLPKPSLPRLRATAATILRAGNSVHREQFAQQGVSFTARSPSQEATADFHIDVGVSTCYDDAWDLVFHYVDAALSPS